MTAWFSAPFYLRDDFAPCGLPGEPSLHAWGAPRFQTRGDGGRPALSPLAGVKVVAGSRDESTAWRRAALAPAVLCGVRLSLRPEQSSGSGGDAEPLSCRSLSSPSGLRSSLLRSRRAAACHARLRVRHERRRGQGGRQRSEDRKNVRTWRPEPRAATRAHRPVVPDAAHPRTGEDPPRPWREPGGGPGASGDRSGLQR